MKSKHTMYVLLFFVVYAGQMSAMEVSESNKKWWHKACIYWALSHFLETKSASLSFEIIGSKKFIAQELRKKLDAKVDDLKELAMYRDDLFESLKEKDESEHFSILRKDFKKLNSFFRPVYLLPFILNLEDTITERNNKGARAVEIGWRKGAYKYFNFKTGHCLHSSFCRGGHCKHVMACLLLDIEKDLTLEELQSDDYASS